MVEPLSPYAGRLQAAMRHAGKAPEDSKAAGWLAEKLGVSYQAAKKAINGETKMLAADNNVKAAHALKVNSEWLATGRGSMLGPAWPFSDVLLTAIHRCDPAQQRQAENAARNVLDMEPLPRLLGEPVTGPSLRSQSGKRAA
jgi:hypothetical protein